ncbi:uncharacterized protein LOC110184907 [Drosophila serrata]|uniref:uncharacterized protein LOC110184907 n=1 Tax=Drosophila serrata TaxID=7274 RepID=UPI000A1D1BFD|nr:uncharacterized protein LOC110184907 [Drosophila serrata]
MDKGSENITQCFLPQLVDKIFENHRFGLSGSQPLEEEQGQLFYDLSRLLGEELVERALHLLDSYTFVYYRTGGNRQRCVVELCKGTEVFRLLPDINYCKCDFFQSHVLQLPRGILYHDIPSSQERHLAGWSEESWSSYTCPHVLALRFHQLLKPRTEQHIKPEQFRQLCGDIFRD